MLQKNRFTYLLLASTLFFSTKLTAAEYTLLIFPVLQSEQIRTTYQPLVKYLSAKTGHRFSILTTTNFLGHWETIKKAEYDLVIDGPHFTAYRLNKLNYTVLAKFPDPVSYTLVAGENEMILEAEEFIGKIIATTPSPGLGALRLYELYPNPLRQPQILEANDSTTAVNLVLNGKAHGAIIPASMVNSYPQLSTVLNTNQVPAPALSASPKMPQELQQEIRKALLEAEQSPEGKKVLEAIKIARFEASDGKEYLPHGMLLKGMWGY